MRQSQFLFLLAVGLLLSLHTQSRAQEWTRFRGPNGSGVSDAKSIPVEWTEADYNWEIDLPGLGHASPVLWGEKIFIHSADANQKKRYLICINAVDGSTIWKKAFPTSAYTMHKFNSPASSTPAVDADHIYLCWFNNNAVTLAAFDHDGNSVWEYPIGPYFSQHGFSTSPIVVDDLVIFNNQQHSDAIRGKDPKIPRSSVLALDRMNGELRWKTPRGSNLASHSVPCLYTPEGGPAELIVPSRSHGIVSYNLESGTVNWAAEGIFKQRTVTSPLIAGGLIFGSNGSGGGGVYAVAVKPGTNAELKYEVTRQASYVPTPVALGNLVFIVSDKGVVTCLDAPSGKRHWRRRVGGDYFSSPIIVDGKLYCASRDGVMVVLAAEADYQMLAKNPLGDNVHATPAVAGGRMYIRTFGKLMSLGGEGS